MIDIEQVKKEIIELLKPLDLERVILFGSYAYGTPNEESDIDLYVVTKDEFVPQSFREKSAVHLKISRAMRDILQRYPTDLITHTKAMHTQFKEINSTFSQEIMTKGCVIL